MTFTRLQFFFILFAIVIGPFLVYKIIWLANSKKTNGRIYFMGSTLEVNGAVSSHLVIIFKASKDSITFNTIPNLSFKTNEPIPVRYQKDDPWDARVDVPDRIWGDTLVYALAPLLILFVLFMTPDRFDPILPRKSKIIIGKKPFIRVVKNEAA
jgi:hypothetical protein